MNQPVSLTLISLGLSIRKNLIHLVISVHPVDQSFLQQHLKSNQRFLLGLDSYIQGLQFWLPLTFNHLRSPKQVMWFLVGCLPQFLCFTTLSIANYLKGGCYRNVSWSSKIWKFPKKKRSTLLKQHSCNRIHWCGLHIGVVVSLHLVFFQSARQKWNRLLSLWLLLYFNTSHHQSLQHYPGE